MKEITAIGIDLGKSVFYVHAVDARGQVVVRKRLSRKGLRGFGVDFVLRRTGRESTLAGAFVVEHLPASSEQRVTPW